jgi:MFS family permease
VHTAKLLLIFAPAGPEDGFLNLGQEARPGEQPPLGAVDDALPAPISGPAGDRRGRRPVTITGAIVISCSGILLAALPALGGAAFSLVVFGLGQSILFAAAVPWLDDSFGAVDRGLAYGGLNLLYATGYTVGPLIGGALLDAASADVVYLLITAVAALCALLLLRQPSESDSSSRPAIRSS